MGLMTWQQGAGWEPGVAGSKELNHPMWQAPLFAELCNHSFVNATHVTMSQKRKFLTLEERIKVIERSDKGDAARRIAADLNVGKTQIQNIIKDKVQFSPF